MGVMNVAEGKRIERLVEQVDGMLLEWPPSPPETLTPLFVWGRLVAGVAKLFHLLRQLGMNPLRFFNHRLQGAGLLLKDLDQRGVFCCHSQSVPATAGRDYLIGDTSEDHGFSGCSSLWRTSHSCSQAWHAHPRRTR